MNHAAQKNQQENLDWLFITVCPALRRKSRFQIQAGKLMRSLPFSIFLYTITQNSKLSRKLIYKHENSMQFPCLYHIPRFSTAFSVKLIRLSAKTANILLLFTFPFYTITETPDFCVKVYFCLIVRFLPQSPSYQRHPKNQKLGSTTHRDEPHETSKSLDFKPFFNTFACEYPNSYGIISELPPVPLLNIFLSPPVQVPAPDPHSNLLTIACYR